jgi:iron complex outermembrane receptor protein
VELAEIRQIEIVKGPNSALYGFNAVGGVINIITYNPRYDDVAFTTLRTGSQNSREIAGARTFSLGDRAGMRLAGGVRKNDNFMAPIDVPGFGEQGGEEERASTSLQAYYLPMSGVEFGVEATYNLAEDTLFSPTYTLLFQELVTRSVKAQVLADTAAGLIRGTFYRNWVDDDVIIPGTTPLAPAIIGTPATFDHQITYMGIEDIFKVVNNHTFRLSGEYRESSLFTLTFTGGKVGYQVWSGAGMWNWQATDTLALTGAVRVDRLNLERSGALPPGFPLTNADWERTLRESSFNAGLVWNASANDTLRLILARGAQLPNLFDLGGSLNPLQAPPLPGLPPVIYAGGLPDLIPTVVTNRELAWDRRFPALNMAMRTALFMGRSSDVLADFGRNDLTLGVINAPTNIGRSEIAGAELSLQGNLVNGWRWGVGYTFTEVDDQFLVQYPVSLTLMDFEHTTPRHQMNLSIGRSSGNWEADAFLYYQSAVDGIRPTDNLLLDLGNIFEVLDGSPAATQAGVLHPLSDYITLDARVAYSINELITVAVSGQNLLHREQVQTIGPAVERRVLMTLYLNF